MQVDLTHRTRDWLPIGVFMVFAAISMLDRQLLAALAPAIRSEFRLSNAQFGSVNSVFSAVTTLASPFAGWLLDRIGLTLGASLALAIWSVSGGATGLTHSLRGVIACRLGLALGESGGGATGGMVLARHLTPAQLGIGAAIVASGTSLGAIAAPLVAAAIAPRYGWRTPFFVCGALGLLWIPLWLVVARLTPARFSAERKSIVPIPGLLADARFWGLIAAYALARQTLWVAWTTLYFVDARHMTMAEANRRFSWYPSAFGAAGAFVAGAIAMYWVRRGTSGLTARLRTCWMLSPLLLATALVPFMPSNGAAAVAIGVSFFGSACLWTSTHLMPIDLYGVARSGFTYAVLEGGFTGLQTIVAPAIGAMIDRFGYTAVCMMMPLLPLLGLAVLTLCLTPARREVAHAA